MSIVSTTELAKAAGVTRATIGNWARKGMPGKIKHGKWDSEVALAWLAEARQDIADERMGRANGSVSELRARLLELQGDGQKLRNEILSSNLIFRNAAEEAWRESIASCIATGDQWVREGRTADDQALRQDLWHELRKRFEQSMGRVSRTLGRGKDVVATRVRISGSMG